MSADHLLNTLQRNYPARLRWLVLQRLGISPLSLSACLLSHRAALRLACHMALDNRESHPQDDSGGNPNFDPAVFARLARRSKL